MNIKVMSSPSERERLLHIQEAIDLIVEYTGPLTLDDFLRDRKTQLVVERLVEILGEAATHLDDDLKGRYPHIPWREIIGLRNVVSHEYFQVRLELLWDVATQDIPNLKEQIATILWDIDG